MRLLPIEPEGYLVCEVASYERTEHWWGHIGLKRNYENHNVIDFHDRSATNMSKELKRLEEASRLITAGLAVLLGVDAASVSEAVTTQKANTKVRETGTDDDEEEPPAKKRRGRPAGGKNKPVVVDDDEDDVPAPVKEKKSAPSDDDDEADDADEEDADEETAAIPKDAVLNELDRTGLKKVAVAQGLDPAGKNHEDLLAMLKDARDGKKADKKKPAPATAADDDEDDEDDDEAPAKPAKGKKAAAAPRAGLADDDYPSLKAQKRDLEAFFKLNKSMLTDMGFFGGKPKKGVSAAPNTYDEVMGDEDLIKEAWADNVWEHVQAGTWDKMKAKAADIEDDD